QIRLTRIGIRQAHGVTAAAMKSPTEMQNLCSSFSTAGSHVLSHLPVHRCLQTILDRQRAALDEKITLQPRETDHALKGLDKFGVAVGVNVRVGDFDFCRAKKIALYCRIIKIRVIEPDRHRAEESVEINELFSRDGVVQIGTPTLIEIDYDFEAVEQDVLLDCFEDFRRYYCPATAGFFAFCGGASIPRCAGRLRDDGRHTHC